MMFDVRENIPIPKALRTSTSSRRKYPFETMAVGAMFFVPGKSKNTLATHASTVGKATGRKFVTRLTYMYETVAGWEPCAADDPHAVRGIGVWRTE